MRIQKKWIRNLEANLPIALANEQIVLVSGAELDDSALRQLGFEGSQNVGASILPAIVGPVSRFNAEGKWIIHRDQPKETRYRQVEWTWEEWRGKDTVQQSDIKDVPYERYPRTLLPPPSVELVITRVGGRLLASLPLQTVDFTNGEMLIHSINLFLELFGSCEILRPSMEPVQVVATHRLNWTILPPGEMPWGTLKRHLEPLYENQSKGRRPVIQSRLEHVAKFSPDFVAVGAGGFSGYIVFGFQSRNIFIFECARYGNATYVFKQDWATLSQLTKAEILQGHLQDDRFIHREGWPLLINNVLKGVQP